MQIFQLVPTESGWDALTEAITDAQARRQTIRLATDEGTLKMKVGGSWSPPLTESTSDPAADATGELTEVLSAYEVLQSGYERVSRLKMLAGTYPDYYRKADEVAADLNETAADLLDRAVRLLKQ
jgi:hypothetical protein